MIKLRLWGTPDEVSAMLESLRDNYELLSVSRQYKDRGESEYVRVYVDVEPPQSAPTKRN